MNNEIHSTDYNCECVNEIIFMDFGEDDRPAIERYSLQSWLEVCGRYAGVEFTVALQFEQFYNFDISSEETYAFISDDDFRDFLREIAIEAWKKGEAAKFEELQDLLEESA